MRVTTKMINNNMMANIAKNKSTLDKYNNQYTTGQKIQKPSDDPIVAVRTLKLRQTMGEIDQYVEKNIPDAMSWMDITTSALDSMDSIITNIYGYLNQGANDILAASERKTVAENLEQLKNQLYSEGNANYTGRYVFTGYKTDTSLTFPKSEDSLDYRITENFSLADIDEVSKIEGSYSLKDYNPNGDPNDSDVNDFSKTPVEVIVHKIQLGYNNLFSEDPDHMANLMVKDANGQTQTFEELGITVVKTSSVDDRNAYDIKNEDGKIVDENGNPTSKFAKFIPETGEIILSDDAHNVLRKANKEITVQYSKNNFAEGEVRPEHYYTCTATDDLGKKIEYTHENQEIKYEVNFGQKVCVNTQISDVVGNNFARTIDGVLSIVNEVNDLENQLSDVDSFLSNQNISDYQREKLNSLKKQLETQLTIKNKMMTNSFEDALDKVKVYQTKINTANANLGSRYSRLEMVEERLKEQYTDYEDLLSENIDVDLVETYINLTSADSVYQSSLSTAAKIAQNSLLDFIR